MATGTRLVAAAFANADECFGQTGLDNDYVFTRQFPPGPFPICTPATNPLTYPLDNCKWSPLPLSWARPKPGTAHFFPGETYRSPTRQSRRSTPAASLQPSPSPPSAQNGPHIVNKTRADVRRLGRIRSHKRPLFHGSLLILHAPTPTPLKYANRNGCLPKFHHHPPPTDHQPLTTHPRAPFAGGSVRFPHSRRRSFWRRRRWVFCARRRPSASASRGLR